MLKKTLILFPILIFSLFFVFSANAQIQSGDVVLSINPQSPRANQSVTATLSTYTTDLNKSMITWILNGATAISGVGKKDFSFNTGVSGNQTTIEAQIQTIDGSSVSKKMTIIPTDIDMLWEAQDAYAPPFYRGKAIVPSEGIIKIVAIPNSSSNMGLSYNWKLDDNNKPDSSGYGKNFYVFRNSYLENENVIEATVSSLMGANIGSGTITVRPGNPKIIFYKKDPSFGVRWEQALGNSFSINPNGETIVAEPYFFSPKNLNSGDLEFKWNLGNSSIETPYPKNELSIKPEAGQSGQSKIGISIENIKRLFLSMNKEINVNF